MRALALAAAFLLLALPALAQTITGPARVIDGDSLEVAGKRIRIHGIDAPELGQTCLDRHGEFPCGRNMAEAMLSAVGEGQITCRERDRDRYGRIVAVCFDDQGNDIGRSMVNSGFAVAYREFSLYYVKEEEEARAERRGLWASGDASDGGLAMAILVTGGAGLIGVAVVRQLLDEGEQDVAVFSRNPSPSRLGDLAGRVMAIAGDVGNFAHVLDAVKTVRPRVIYHLGAMLSVPSEADPAAAVQTNAMGTFHVLEAARLFDVEQVIFSSSIATYGHALPDDKVDDRTIQRPRLFYGVTKVFGEHMGLFYRRKYGLDFRGIRYPSVVGPGVATPGVAQYTSLMIEASARGEPFTVWVEPETRIPIIYITEAAAAAVLLARAPRENIRMVNYLVDGMKPTPTAAELAGVVRGRIPGAEITFEPDPNFRSMLSGLRPLDDRRAREEWGWEPTHDLGRMIDDFIAAME